MREFTVVFTPQADEDFDNIIDHIAKDDPVRALSFVQELRDRACNALSMVPRGGAAFKGSYFFPFGNYVVVYDIDDANSRVVVHMISHSRRQWKSIFLNRL